MQKDAGRFFVDQAGPDIYEKNEMWKKQGGCVFFCYSLYLAVVHGLRFLTDYLLIRLEALTSALFFSIPFPSAYI